MRFIQIWILPDTADLAPGVEQRVFTKDDRTNRLLKVIGPEGGAVVKVHQNSAVYVARLDTETEVRHRLGFDRGAYLYLIDGAARVGEHALGTGDAAKITDLESFAITAEQTTELILVDVPMRFAPVGIWAGRG